MDPDPSVGHKINKMGRDTKENLLNEKSAEKLAVAPVSDNTISRIICSIAEHLEEMFTAKAAII